MRRLLLVLLLVLACPAWAAETKPFVKGSWAALRAAYAGRPLVVHLWSLTCAPCLAELPEWGRRTGGGFDLVMLATDPVEQAPRLAATLARAGLGEVESWAFADPFAEALRFEIDRRWRGELPRTLLVGADGTVSAVSGVLDGAVLDAWLKEAAHAPRP